MALCVAGAGLVAKIATAAFTLAWSHTVEHQPWHEAWRVEGDQLVLTEMRVTGSGAGMEPPDGAQLVDGRYVWRPADARREKIVLRRARDPDGAIGDWRLCPAGEACRELGEILGAAADPVTLAPCD